MTSKIALVLGASRGIGRQIAITMSENGYKVGVAAKTTQHTEKLPGTIYSVSEEIQTLGGEALPIPCNVRDEYQIKAAVDQCMNYFGGLNCVIYNAGAITWDKVANTPLKRFDLMHEVNLRGAYCTIQNVLPLFLKQKSGCLLFVSPPIYSRFFKGKTPYSCSKVGLTVLVNGLAGELQNTGVTVSALWPATATESHVTTVQQAPPYLMRKSTLFADACVRIIAEKSEKFNGKALLDEDLLRDEGISDFTKYRCDPNAEPPRMMPRKFPSLQVEEEFEPVISKL